MKVKVPLVIYKNGERQQIGEATIYRHGDGLLVFGEVKDTEVQRILMGDMLTSVSIEREAEHNG